ncbi:MAG: protein translocase subunit SecF [Fastidiosipilaceae bacterium]|jgi:preprotein translocase SecF subunit
MFSFYKHRHKFMAGSLALILVGFIALFVFGLNLDIQFKGGSILTYTYEGEIDLNEIEPIIEDTLEQSVSLQLTENLGTKTRSLVVNVAGDDALSTEKQTSLRSALTENFPDAQFKVSETNVVDPFIGRETLIKGLLAILVASALIVIYVWIRFRTISGPSAGVFSLLALFHDVLIAFFVFIFMRAALNETVIAVVLSILGWSVNDTIVIFDRIRENKGNRANREETLPQLVDRSINEVLSRSITTSVCAFLAVSVAYVFSLIYNIESIREFALPMMVGMVVGSYSSIFLATPFWAQWMTRNGRSGFES